MAKYQVAIIPWPVDWRPGCPDDVPPRPGRPLEMLTESEDPFEVVRRAIEHNEKAEAEKTGRWAVVVEPGSPGRAWPTARLCTPIHYRVTPIWWPEAWEPNGPLDVPNCVWQAQSHGEQPRLTCPQALATVRGLNRQCMDRPGTTWYVVAAVENEPLSRTVSYDPAGTETTVEVQRIHVIRPEPGGRGDCSHCPAHSFPCADADWTSRVQTVSTTQTGPVRRDTD